MERGGVAELLAGYEAMLAEQPWMRELPIAMALGAPHRRFVAGRPDQARAKLRLLAAGRFDVVPVDSEWLSTLASINLSVLVTEDVVSAAVLRELLSRTPAGWSWTASRPRAWTRSTTCSVVSRCCSGGATRRSSTWRPPSP